MTNLNTLQKAIHNFAHSRDKHLGAQLRKLKRFLNISNKSEKRSKKLKQNYISHALHVHRVIYKKYQ